MPKSGKLNATFIQPSKAFDDTQQESLELSESIDSKGVNSMKSITVVASSVIALLAYVGAADAATLHRHHHHVASSKIVTKSVAHKNGAHSKMKSMDVANH